jgi:hypothetical protein
VAQRLFAVQFAQGMGAGGRNSLNSVIKGNITVKGRPAAARISACNCIRSTPGLSSPTRIARQPIAGFGSSGGFM